MSDGTLIKSTQLMPKDGGGNPMLARMKGGKIITTYSNVKTDNGFEDADFTFTPPEGAKEGRGMPGMGGGMGGGAKRAPKAEPKKEEPKPKKEDDDEDF